MDSITAQLARLSVAGAAAHSGSGVGATNPSLPSEKKSKKAIKRAKKHAAKKEKGSPAEKPDKEEPRAPKTLPPLHEGTGKKASPDMFAKASMKLGSGDLESWQLLCEYFGLADKAELTSKKKCMKALRRVWVNIHDLVIAIVNDQQLKPFATKNQLEKYTFKHKLLVPREEAKKNPLMKVFLTDFFV